MLSDPTSEVLGTKVTPGLVATLPTVPDMGSPSVIVTTLPVESREIEEQFLFPLQLVFPKDAIVGAVPVTYPVVPRFSEPPENRVTPPAQSVLSTTESVSFPVVFFLRVTDRLPEMTVLPGARDEQILEASKGPVNVIVIWSP
jgi:hypothetical protein